MIEFLSRGGAVPNKWLQATFDPLRTLASVRARIASNASEPRRYGIRGRNYGS